MFLGHVKVEVCVGGGREGVTAASTHAEHNREMAAGQEEVTEREAP